MGPATRTITALPIWPLVFCWQERFKGGTAGFEAIALARVVEPAAVRHGSRNPLLRGIEAVLVSTFAHLRDGLLLLMSSSSWSFR